MEKIVSLCKRRGFVFPGSEIYGGLANSWDYGPVGVELKNNIKKLWWERFVHRRSDIVGIDASLIMNPKVWQASGHVATFNDPMAECKKCHERYRADKMPEKCEQCGGKEFTDAKQFNLMFRTHIGAVESDDNLVYLRPETAQAMFVDFKNVLDTSRKTIPFGIAQIGKAFRNEITPGNFIFRTREFEQMEIEYFIKPPQTDEDWNKVFEDWRKEMLSWITADLDINLKNIHELEVPKEDLAHYSKRTIDFEYRFPFGVDELYGLAYRTDFDLSNHQKASGQKLEYTDPHTNEKYVPHVIEPTWGVDRSVLAVLVESYREEGEGKDKRVYLALPPKLAPYKVAVFPLMANKPQLVEKARSIYQDLQKHFTVAWDERGNVGKRYYSQDEVGTPFCITVDFDSLEDGTVTVRDRDTKEQPRVKVEELENYIRKFLE
ncbi:MAG: glycine--tRNA ligase [Candidatus Doudnabacteria bacterium CG10_big_fil_rev_8_21_14_0_10_42_18]|uniref:Glycine--tRNA ligase n=1 Tax=Candidatus Doudnabacteria bacterium CG10_big_fil_rev_8_21_14_0_10_42_18 TaxID=1974552 RepID=A0A2H0VA74_9BACT|nr:MAG: glycine--tRNA ligase [Candidatus Doudnabacteria bacterium CG10_big_fil_rev_8_21_14_0_10_42_18]